MAKIEHKVACFAVMRSENKKSMRIETEYHRETHRVTTRYDRPIQLLFRKTANTVSDVFNPEIYAQVCRKAGDTSPSDFASGAQLLRDLGSSLAVTASGEDYDHALSLVAWTILTLTDLKRPVSVLPVALTGLAYIAPIRLPKIELPDSNEVFGVRSVSSETRQAYEEIRSVECRNLGSIPVVASANRLWRELRSIPSMNPAFQEFLGILETSSLMFRRSLEALAKANGDYSKKGGRR
jgi:hypothetical protein